MQLLLLLLPLPRPILHQHLRLLHHTLLPQLHLTPLPHPHHMPLLRLLPLLLKMNMVPPKLLFKTSTDLLKLPFQTDMPHPSLLMQLQQVFGKI